MHDKASVEVTQADKQAKLATESEEVPTQRPAGAATAAVEASVNVAEKTSPISRDEFWRKVPIWKDVSMETFMSYRWTVSLLPFSGPDMQWAC